MSAHNGMVIDNGTDKIGEWKLVDESGIYGRYWLESKNSGAGDHALDLASMTVSLLPQESTLSNNKEGNAIVSATILVNEKSIGEIQLISGSRDESAPEQKENPSASPGVAEETTNTKTPLPEPSLELYDANEVVANKQSPMAQYGWVIIVGAVAVAAIVIIAIGISIRNKMEQ